MDLFPEPTDKELTNRKENRHKNCKHVWGPGARGEMTIRYKGKLEYHSSVEIVEDYEICSECKLIKNRRKRENGSIPSTE